MQLPFGEVDPLRLANAKLQGDASSAALKLMDCLFSAEEMVNGNPSGSTNSKDPTRQTTIKPLDARKMAYIYGVFCYCQDVCMEHITISLSKLGTLKINLYFTLLIRMIN